MALTNDFAPGMRVLIRDEEWRITRIENNTLGNKALYCVGISTLVKDKEAIFLSDLEPDLKIVNPAEIKLVEDDSSKYEKSLLYIESQWRQKIPTDNEIHIGHKASMDLLPYQLDPTAMALNKPRQRILIADAVGLGKTLEAGILISELIARGKGKRILVATGKSMMMQFQKEMWNRFTIPLVRLDSKQIQKIRANLPSNYNPFNYYDKTIISIDTLKRDVEYRTHLESAHWDIIVIDEAQSVAFRGDKTSQLAKLAQLLSEKSDTMIMLSATPHDGKAKSFASLMGMLDPTAIANPEKYTKDDIKGLFIRRFKKDIKEQLKSAFLERHIEFERSSASLAEENVYDYFVQMKLIMDANKEEKSSHLFKTTLKKALFSSPVACLETIKNRLNKLTEKYSEADMPDISALKGLQDKLEQVSVEQFSRYQHLLSLLKSPAYGWDRKAKDDRIVIFTERVATMKFIAEQLRKDLGMTDKEICEISGQMSDVDLQEIVEEFGRQEKPIRILVASDVASEGLNLHYLSHRMIHFDIPWSLMVFQQRNGRIDRYGQSKRPDIRYFMIDSQNNKIKGDARILEILTEKERQAVENIGDPTMIMGVGSVEEEEELTAKAMESNLGNDFLKQTISFDSIFNEIMGNQPTEEKHQEEPVHGVEDKTLYTDLDYARRGINMLSVPMAHQTNSISCSEWLNGIDVKLPADFKYRLTHSVMPDIDFKDDLRLSSDKTICMAEMKKCMQSMGEKSPWPEVQYLWAQHPIFSYINDKVGLFYKRDEAPVLSVALPKNEVLYIVSGIIPNLRSTPVIDEFFGVSFVNGTFNKIVAMDEIRPLLDINKMINSGSLDAQQVKQAQSLLPNVVNQATAYLKSKAEKKKKGYDQQIDEEIDKLDELEKKHIGYQMELFQNNKNKQDTERRRIDRIFNDFTDYVKETMTIQPDKPYIKIVSVLIGKGE